MNKEVLIIYNYIAHYRTPIFSLLSRNLVPRYTIAAGDYSEIKIKLMEESISKIDPKDGGINFLKLTNIWIFKLFLIQPQVLLLCFSKKYNSIIFLGNMYYLTTWLGGLIARLTGKKVVFWTHGYIREERNFQGFVRKIFYQIPHEILVYGQRAKDILISKGFNSEKVSLIYNSLDFDKQVKIVNETQCKNLELFKDNTLPVVGFIGRLTKQKKLDLLINVMSELISKGIKANLLIIGDGEEKKVLMDCVNELNLENNVNFYGACYDETLIYNLMKNMRVLVSPGEVGLTAIHSLTYGVPVITHNRFDMQMPEYEVITPGVTGDFFDYFHAEKSLMKALEKWLMKNEYDINRDECFKIISEKYNPHTQLKIFNQIV